MMRIMVVDDSMIIRKQIERILSGSDFKFVGSAFDGGDALKQFIKLRPQVVTMDLTMPRMDGIETTKRMLRVDPDVRILVVSALRDKRTAMRAIRLGAYGFLYKPFTEFELTQALSELFNDISESTWTNPTLASS